MEAINLENDDDDDNYDGDNYDDDNYDDDNDNDVSDDDDQHWLGWWKLRQKRGNKHLENDDEKNVGKK